MALVAGIDEAGYGPVLGPLVVSRVVWGVPDTRPEHCLWQSLKNVITSRNERNARRTIIADSKLLYRGKRALSALEQTALTVLSLSGDLPTSLGPILESLCPNVCSQMTDYPWYQDLEVSIPVACNPEMVTIRSAALEHECRLRHIDWLGARSSVILEGQYNKLVSQTRNKASLLWGVTLELIDDLLRTTESPLVFIHVDRQGGRTHYGDSLLSAYPHAELKIISESQAQSVYHLAMEGRNIRVQFSSEAESHHMPVALASIYSKYVRELLMLRFNRFWQKHDSSLVETAGYYQDGMRFLRDIEPVMQRLSIDRRLLVRLK